jgi:hypothetical protein
MELAGKRAAGGVVAVMLVLQLMAAPTVTMAARSVQDDDDDGGTSPVLSLNTIAREFSYADGAKRCGETCIILPCITTIIGCKCRKWKCVRKK